MTSQKCNKQTYEDFFCMDVNHLKDYLTIIQSTEEQAQMLNEEYRKKLKDCNLPN